MEERKLKWANTGSSKRWQNVHFWENSSFKDFIHNARMCWHWKAFFKSYWNKACSLSASIIFFLLWLGITPMYRAITQHPWTFRKRQKGNSPKLNLDNLNKNIVEHELFRTFLNIYYFTEWKTWDYLSSALTVHHKAQLQAKSTLNPGFFILVTPVV